MSIAEHIRSRIAMLKKYGRDSYTFESEAYKLCCYIGWAAKYKKITITEASGFAEEVTNIIEGVCY